MKAHAGHGAGTVGLRSSRLWEFKYLQNDIVAVNCPSDLLENEETALGRSNWRSSRSQAHTHLHVYTPQVTAANRRRWPWTRPESPSWHRGPEPHPGSGTSPALAALPQDLGQPGPLLALLMSPADKVKNLPHQPCARRSCISVGNVGVLKKIEISSKEKKVFSCHISFIKAFFTFPVLD